MQAEFPLQGPKKFAKRHASTDSDSYFCGGSLVLVPVLTDVNEQHKFYGERLPFQIILSDADVDTGGLAQLVEEFKHAERRSPVWSQILMPLKGQPVETMMNITLQPPGVKVPAIKSIDSSAHLKVAEPTYNATPKGAFVGIHVDRGLRTICWPLEEIKIWLLFPHDEDMACSQEDDRIAVTEGNVALFVPPGWYHVVYTLEGGFLGGFTYAGYKRAGICFSGYQAGIRSLESDSCYHGGGCP